MKFTQNSDPRGLKGPIRQADQNDPPSPEPRSAQRPVSPGKTPGLRVPPTEYDYGSLAMNGNPGPDPAYRPAGPARNGGNYASYQEPPRRGRSKVCGLCGGLMRKSSRRVLSAIAGCMLIVLGAALMALYGLAINFFQVPWYATFALPAGYYIGSLFVGVGVLFFFIRERIWYCPNCQHVDKR